MKKVNLQEKIIELRKENTVFDRLMKDLGSFDKLPKHLQEDALKRMKIKKVVSYIEI
jgi:hypothetical protein